MLPAPNKSFELFEIKRQTNSSQSSLKICANYPYWRSIFGRLLKTKGLAMPKASPSFKIGSSKAKKSPRPKMQNRQENPNTQNLMKQKIEVLKSPIKSESDKKEYKVIRLKNGLRALLISDLNSLKEKCGEVRSMLHECDEVTNDGQWMDGVHSGSDSESEGSSLEESEADESVDEEETDENDEDVEDNEGRRHANRQMDSGDEKMAACALTTGVGSFSDPEHIQGLAHFVEHMLFMGSKKFPKENDFDSFIKKKGGSDNAQTDCENTTFHFEIQENFLEKGMDKFSQFFVAPLMRQEAMQREREAIESEFALALPSDEHRHDQLLGGLLPVGHPARTFMWGNLKSLSAPVGPEDPALHAAAHEFRKKHYSAHRMTVAVQARLPLDTLEKYVVSTFGLIPNNGLPADDFSMHAFKPEDITKEFNSIYYIKPISQVTELNLTWCMRSFLEEYKSKPHQYVSWILGHEGADSLLSHLRKKVWALEIYTGNSESGIDHTSLLCFFTVTIVLTQEGLKHWREVLDDVFAYINMLRKECPNERIFKEIQSIEEMNFRFAEECQPCDNVENLAENMQFYPPEHYLTGADLFYEYNPDGITYVLDCMVPEKVNIMVLSQQHEEPPEYDQIEEWFGTEYKKTEIPEADLKRWKEIAPYEEFRLPEPNIFITDNFDLIPLPSKLTELVGTEDKPSEPAAVPAPVAEKKKKASPKSKAGKKQIQKIEIPEVSDEEKKALQMKAEAQKLRIDSIRSILDAPPSLLINDGLLELWYKPDYKFRLPNAFINIHLISPIVMTSCKDSTLLDIWCQILKQMLTEKLYAAGMARLYHEMYPYEKGLSIRLWGFSQKLPILADVITKTMRDYRQVLTEPLYLAIRDIQSKRYHNSIYKPSQLVKFALTLDTYWTNMQKLEALEEIKYEDVETIRERFLEKLLVQMLVQGNLMKEDALALGKTMRNNLDWKLLKEEEKPKVRVLQIPAGSKFCRVIGLNKDNSNSNITNYYQSGAYSLRESCIIETIVMLMEEPLFDTLRTKEQLGYNVFCMLRSTFGVLGLSVTVNTQVEKYSADHIDERIESFLASFGEDVKKLPLKTFEQTRRALIKMKRCVDVELKDEFSRNWAEISSAEYSFNRLQEEIECLKTITIEEIQQWYDEHSMSGSKKNFKKLSVQVIGNKKGESPEPIAPKILDCAKEMSKANPTILQLNLIPGCTKTVSDEPAPEFILSVEEFRAPLEMYPEVKHPLPAQTPLI